MYGFDNNAYRSDNTGNATAILHGFDNQIETATGWRFGHLGFDDRLDNLSDKETRRLIPFQPLWLRQ